MGYNTRKCSFRRMSYHKNFFFKFQMLILKLEFKKYSNITRDMVYTLYVLLLCYIGKNTIVFEHLADSTQYLFEIDR